MDRNALRFPSDICSYGKRLGLTQTTLAMCPGVQKSTVTTWECGYHPASAALVCRRSGAQYHGRESLLATVQPHLANGGPDARAVPVAPRDALPAVSVSEVVCRRSSTQPPHAGRASGPIRSNGFGYSRAGPTSNLPSALASDEK
jgi:hypothetical protein